MGETITASTSAGVRYLCGVQTWNMLPNTVQPHCPICEFVRYMWLGTWSQVSQVCPGGRKEERLKNYVSNVGAPSINVGSVT